MKKMTTREIQEVGLELMKEIHSFCVNNNINYSLAYGTMLGAIRHNGFIPWDDDVDIMMPRPDYEKFIQLYKSNHYLLKTTRDKDCFTNFTRLYEIKRTFTEHPIAKPCNDEVGVFVDVFPVDGVYDNPQKQNLHYKRVVKIAKARLAWRFIMADLKKNSIVFKLRPLLSLIKLCLVNCGGSRIMLKKLTKLSTEVPFGNSAYCSYYCCNDAMKKGKQEIFPMDSFRHFQLCTFETEEFYISSLYDQMLTTMYGDYMKLPPEEDRGPKHGFVNYYWK